MERRKKRYLYVMRKGTGRVLAHLFLGKSERANGIPTEWGRDLVQLLGLLEL